MDLIVCVDEGWGIGYQGSLLADIPEDKRWFREITMGGAVLGGRTTMEGLPGGRPLRGRSNLVLTGREEYAFGDAVVVHSVSEAMAELAKYPEEMRHIIGGGSVYRQFLPYCSKAYVTRVRHRFAADTFFPNLDGDAGWERVHTSAERTYGGLSYCFSVYHRKGSGDKQSDV